MLICANTDFLFHASLLQNFVNVNKFCKVCYGFQISALAQDNSQTTQVLHVSYILSFVRCNGVVIEHRKQQIILYLRWIRVETHWSVVLIFCLLSVYVKGSRGCYDKNCIVCWYTKNLPSCKIRDGNLWKIFFWKLAMKKWTFTNFNFKLNPNGWSFPKQIAAYVIFRFLRYPVILLQPGKYPADALFSTT